MYLCKSQHLLSSTHTMRFWARAPREWAKKEIFLSLRFFPEAAREIGLSRARRSLCVLAACRAHNMRLFTFASYISSLECLSISRLFLVHASHAYQVHLHQPAWISHGADKVNGTRRHYILKGDTLHFIDLVHHTVWLTHAAKSATDSGSDKSFSFTEK